MSAVFGVLLLMFFATLFRALGLGCVCIGMSGSRILLPSYFTRGLPRVLCNADEQASNLRSVQMCFNGEENATSNFQGHYTSRKHNCNTVPGRVLLLYIYQDTAPMPRRAAPGTATCISKSACPLHRAASACCKTLHAVPPKMPSLPPSFTLCAGQAMLKGGFRY